MDRSIALITPAMHRTCGAQAFYEGRGVDDHHLHADTLAIEYWQMGWREAQAGQLAEACPP